MKRISALAAGAAAAGALLLGGTLPALASGGATVRAPAAVFQGSGVEVTTHCPDTASLAVLSSRMWGTVTLPILDAKVHVYVGRTVRAHKYPVHLLCLAVADSKLVASATTSVTVRSWRKLTPPPRPAFSGKADLVIRTGFGGMARSVAAHHPVA